MFGVNEMFVIIGVVLLVLLFFGGTKRLKNLGSDLGSSLRDFRKAINDDEKKDKTEEDK